MSIVVVTGSWGLVGSETCLQFAKLGFSIVGIDNDTRGQLFGSEGSTEWMNSVLERSIPNYSHYRIDIRDSEAINRVFSQFGKDIALVVHAAAQPSHDWAASNPIVDFSINATGTLVLLEAVRAYCPEAAFIFLSSNKVYGDKPNRLPVVEKETRWEIEESHTYANGIREDMGLDFCLHSLMGVSKTSADLLVQEFGRYWGMKTVSFRGGCLAGSGHSGTQMHGFLAYLMKCAATGTPYRVFGYLGKQVRDNLHSSDLVKAFVAYFNAPKPGEVYNLGGGRTSHSSLIEAAAMCERIVKKPLQLEFSEKARIGDHIWYVSDCSKFISDYPEWQVRRTVPEILEEIFEVNKMRFHRLSRHAERKLPKQEADHDLLPKVAKE